VDLTSHNAAEQCETVEEILKMLKVDQKPRITAMNKIDLLLSKDRDWRESQAVRYISEKSGEPQPNTVLISASKKWGLNRLLEMISVMIEQNVQAGRLALEINSIESASD